MSDFARPSSPSAFKFAFRGWKTNAAPNSLAPDKYALAVNIRAYEEDSVRTRPGYTLVNSGGKPYTDVRAYASLGTDDLPRIIARDTFDAIWLADAGLGAGQIGSLVPFNGLNFSPSAGASLIPFRPSASPQPWMYVANGFDYQKFSSPNVNALGQVTQFKVGIAEPQKAPDAWLASISAGAPLITGGWTNGGTAGAASASNRIATTGGIAVPDPLTPNLTSIGVIGTISFQRQMSIFVGGVETIVNDVFAPLASSLQVLSIYFPDAASQVGATGRCIIVASQVGSAGAASGAGGGAGTGGGQGGGGVGGVGGRTFLARARQRASASPQATPAPPSVPPRAGTPAQGTPTLPSNYAPDWVSNIRRGSLITITTGATNETVIVWSVTPGLDGSAAIETSVALVHTLPSTVAVIPAIQVPLAGVANGASLTAPAQSYQVTTGLGTQTAVAASPNPFVQAGQALTPDDYISFGVLVDNLSNLTELRLLLDVSDGTFTKDFFFYSARSWDLANAFASSSPQTILAADQIVAQRALIDEQAAKASTLGSQTQIEVNSSQQLPGSGVWVQVTFPIALLTRVGTDASKSLQTLVKVQVFWNASGTINVQQAEIDAWGGGQLDVGDQGAPYQYRVRGRNLSTGAVGNPSPATRYGVSPRRSNATVRVPTIPDPQYDTADIFRYGGTVTSWRYIGSVQASSGVFPLFADSFDDDAASAGDELDFDNFEPWPSVGLPNTNAIALLAGTYAVVTSTDTLTANYLPGTLVQIGGQNVYTLRRRPVLLAAPPILTYQFEFEEDAGVGSILVNPNLAYTIQEPIIARQFLPYMWGPDAAGTAFAVGDSLRPGTLVFTKPYAMDMASDQNNLELVPPTEPLQGGIIVDGLSFVASTERWWALYSQLGNTAQPYNPVQTPDTRGSISPWGIATDGRQRFWWAKDGIYSSDAGSLTDADLYNLFPHEGVAGRDQTYAGVTIPTPNYQAAKQFRLAHSNGYLYATYVDAVGNYHQLTFDLKRMAWSIDNYAVQITTIYHVEQQPASGALGAATLNPVVLLAGQTAPIPNAGGALYRQTDFANDNTIPISGALATFEFDAGDLRAPKQWGDLFADVVPSAPNVQVQLFSQGVGIIGPFTLAQSPSRVRIPIDLTGVIISDFAGLVATWSDDFRTQTVHTRWFAWQPSYDVQPAADIAWYTFGTTFSIDGYMHIREMLIAYVATAPIVLTPSVFDGQAPAPITLPSTGGKYAKSYFPFSANKGLLYSFTAKSAAKFQIFLDESELHVGQWGRQGPYATMKKFGGPTAEEGVTQ